MKILKLKVMYRLLLKYILEMVERLNKIIMMMKIMKMIPKIIIQMIMILKMILMIMIPTMILLMKVLNNRIKNQNYSIGGAEKEE